VTTRRTFLGAVAGGLSAAALDRLASAAEPKKAPYGLQLYSLRREMDKDLPGTLAKIKAWGIDEVESAGYHGRTAPEFAAELKKAGLRCLAMHVGWNRLKDELPVVLKEAEALGAKFVINPSIPFPRTQPKLSREQMLEAAGAFAKWSKDVRAAGLRFGYHMHGQEFAPAPEGTMFDVLAKESGPDVGFEIDVFWAIWGGADPLKLMEKYAGRIWLTHIKDMAKGTEVGKSGQDFAKLNVVIGTGMIDIAGIVRAGAKAGVEVHYIEDESTDPVANIPQSVGYLKGLKA
jgi:sugar phosphate isomerase/epimerase